MRHACSNGCCLLLRVAVVVAAVIHGFGSVFAGLFEGVAAIVSAAALFALLVVFPLLMELLALLSTGQVIPFVRRLVQLLGSF